MPDLNPFALWRRFLAAPNESRGKTLAMAFLVSGAAALAVSGASVWLGPKIAANRAAEAQARLDAMIASVPGLAEVLAESGAEGLEAVVVELATGNAAATDPASFDPATVAQVELAPEADIAGLKTRPAEERIFVVRDGGKVTLAVLPVSGAGYQGIIKGFLAIEGDFNTVAALTITEQSETPGLGAKITEPAWQALWPGTRLMDEAGEIRVAVRQGGATTEYEVDGITGATRTGSGVSDMIRFWVGPDGYGPLIEALKEGRL